MTQGQPKFWPINWKCVQYLVLRYCGTQTIAVSMITSWPDGFRLRLIASRTGILISPHADKFQLKRNPISNPWTFLISKSRCCRINRRYESDSQPALPNVTSRGNRFRWHCADWYDRYGNGFAFMSSSKRILIWEIRRRLKSTSISVLFLVSRRYATYSPLGDQIYMWFLKRKGSSALVMRRFHKAWKCELLKTLKSTNLMWLSCPISSTRIWSM
jgi:hypothetical protein